jgi:hypothetical protein
MSRMKVHKFITMFLCNEIKAEQIHLDFFLSIEEVPNYLLIFLNLSILSIEYEFK